MSTFCCCFYWLQENDQVKLNGPSSRYLVDGPISCAFFSCCLYSTEFSKIRSLGVNQQCVIVNQDNISETRYEFGPALIKLKSPWENFSGPTDDCIVLDQDDYLVIRDKDGFKRIERGPKVYHPREYGDVVEEPGILQSIQIPLNHYIIMEDANSTTHPIQHIRGPNKIYLEPFQTALTNTDKAHQDKMRVSWKDPNNYYRTITADMMSKGAADIAFADTSKGVHSKFYFPCVEITTGRAIYLQLASKNAAGETVVLIDTPQFYMPKIGEKVLSFTERVILLNTDFCILKSPHGEVFVMNGEHEQDRSFFIKPFYELLSFDCDTKMSILSTLPTFMPHTFDVRTSDNVVLTLYLRISYQIQNVEAFSNHPIDFYAQIKNHVQNVLLSKFSTIKLREFMNTFSLIAQGSIESVSEYFNTYGIEILDIQILNYKADFATQKLLDKDIETSVQKQNELRATQNDIAIQEETNVVNRKIKDLEVEMAQKDNEVALEKKQLENAIRVKEMEIEIQEEIKRKELLEQRRGNDLVEAEFAGKSHGHEFNEFVRGIDSKFTVEQKLEIWRRQNDLQQAKIVYSRLEGLNMYPPEADKNIYKFGSNLEAEVKKGMSS